MSNIDLFTRFIGFPSDFRTNLVETKYPPYNIIKIGENNFLIELAVAGFTSDDISVSLDNTTLKVVGEQSEPGTDKPNVSYHRGEWIENGQFLHKGIACRRFTQTFSLAENIEISKIDMKDGILSIHLTKVLLDEETKVYKVGYDANNQQSKWR